MTVKVYLYATEASTEMSTCELSGVASVHEAIEIVQKLGMGNGVDTNIVVWAEEITR
jgi:hypothetical protein